MNSRYLMKTWSNEIIQGTFRANDGRFVYFLDRVPGFNFWWSFVSMKFLKRQEKPVLHVRIWIAGINESPVLEDEDAIRFFEEQGIIVPFATVRSNWTSDEDYDKYMSLQ